MSAAFRRAPWAAAAAMLASITAMLLYPGGTARDRTTTGYRITGNFLSDLGMTVAYDGRPNRVGAALFVASLVLLIVGMGGALLGFVGLYSTDRRARGFALAALALGVVDSVCFAGVALTPENRAMPLHVSFTLAAFRILPFVVLPLAFAAAATPGAPRLMSRAWGILTVVLLCYVAMLQGGAWTATSAGFAALVIAQKVVTIITVTIVLWQCRMAMGSVVRREQARP